MSYYAHQPEPVILNAARQNRGDILEFYLSNGVDPDETNDTFSSTALMCAAFHDNTEAVKVLLKYGADPLKTDVCGRTALSIACTHKFQNTIALLEEHIQQQEAWKNEV